MFAALVSTQAATIANWKVLFAASPLTVGAVATSGLNTDSPVFGQVTPVNNLDGVGLAGKFGTVGSPESVTLAIGETLEVSATITLTGGTATAAGAYRFAVLDDGGKFDAGDPNLWSGGWIYTVGGSLFRASTGGNYMSALSTPPNNAENVMPELSTTGTLSGNTATPYLWTMSITRTSADTVDLFTSFVGGVDFSQTMTKSGVSATNFTYTSVGIQATAQVDLDQMTISNARFSVIPEPSTALLGGLGVLCLVRRRR